GEAEHQVAQIINERRVSQAQPAFEDVLTKAREKAAEDAAAGKIGHGNTLSVRAAKRSSGEVDFRMAVSKERLSGFVPTPSCVSQQPLERDCETIYSTNISVHRWSQGRSSGFRRTSASLVRIGASRKPGLLAGSKRDTGHHRAAMVATAAPPADSRSSHRFR